MTSLQEHIGANVKAFRGKTSPSELGAALELWLGKPWTRQAVWEAENGKRAFTAAELLALAAVLNVTLPQLFESADDLDLPSGGTMPATLIDALVLGTNKERDQTVRLLRSARALKRAHEDLGASVLGLGLEVRELESAIHGAPRVDPAVTAITGHLDVLANAKSAGWRRPIGKLKPFEAVEDAPEQGERDE